MGNVYYLETKMYSKKKIMVERDIRKEPDSSFHNKEIL